MSGRLRQMRPVYVVGIGLHRYQRLSGTPYTELGLTAVREALGDAGIAWPEVQSVFTGTGRLGMAPTRVMLRHLGVTGIPMTQVENASASGSTAFRLAVNDVAAGFSDVSLALGVDKPYPRTRAPYGVGQLSENRVAPFTHFALLAEEYMRTYGVSREQIARVALKNHANGATNANAQRRRARTLDEILDDEPIAGFFGRLQCCPIGEGAAAVILASEEAVARLGLDLRRGVRVLAATQRSEVLYGDKNFDAELTRTTSAAAFDEAEVAPSSIDIVEVHDAFSVEELLYLESMGIAEEGQAALALERGEFDIGGRVAVSPSGGLLAMGHPIGPTGVGQVAEITRQLRGEAGERQHPGATTGLAHMVGVGAVCVVSILQRAQT